MQKILHIAKASVRKHKNASISLFVIITIVSSLLTIGFSVLLGAGGDYTASIDRLNSLHSILVMKRDMYNPSFEDYIRDDPRVSQYDVSEAICLSYAKLSYGGEVEVFESFYLNLDAERDVSAPKITEEDLSLPRDRAIYLPVYAKGHGQTTGDAFTITYRNKTIELVVAGFFETNEFSSIGHMGLRFFVPEECFEALRLEYGASVWIAVRFWDINDSERFNDDFAANVDIELSRFMSVCDADMMAAGFIYPLAAFSAIIVVFALLISFISLLVIRFRVSHSIENSMHDIGVLKASGYTSREIINCYILEYGMISFPAALLGVIAPVLVFPAIRRVLGAMVGFPWTLGVNFAAGLIISLFLVALLLFMVTRTCRKIKKLPPVDALRGGASSGSSRRNYFPLHKGYGGAQIRLGLKNIFAYFKFYAMIGLVIAGISLAVVFIAVLFRNFVVDQSAMIEIAGFEAADVIVDVTRHTDADALAAAIEQMPDVRKTSMYDDASFDVDGIRVMGHLSNDFGLYETMRVHDGRFPVHDDEIAFPILFAEKIGKKIGDSVSVKANGVSQNYTVTGYFSVASNGGRVAAITLGGYQRLDPNYRRGSVNVYLNENAGVAHLTDKLTRDYGVLNVYRQNGDSGFAAAKTRAEEKISAYLERYNIDSVEYAVIYNDEIIISGSSSEYQIEKITDARELAKSQIGIFSDTMALVTQAVAVVSLVVIFLILSMTVRSIIAKRRRELGAMKALGFTTGQLARQMAISFMPMTLLGVVAGCVAGASLVNPAMGAMLAATGAYSVNFTMDPIIIVLLGVLITLVAYITANISAMGIRHISAYELLTE